MTSYHGEASTCASNVYQPLSPPQLKGPWYDANILPDLQGCGQWPIECLAQKQVLSELEILLL